MSKRGPSRKRKRRPNALDFISINEPAPKLIKKSVAANTSANDEADNELNKNMLLPKNGIRVKTLRCDEPVSWIKPFTEDESNRQADCCGRRYLAKPTSKIRAPSQRRQPLAVCVGKSEKAEADEIIIEYQTPLKSVGVTPVQHSRDLMWHFRSVRPYCSVSGPSAKASTSNLDGPGRKLIANFLAPSQEQILAKSAELIVIDSPEDHYGLNNLYRRELDRKQTK